MEVDPGGRSWKFEAQEPGLKIKAQEVKKYRHRLFLNERKGLKVELKNLVTTGCVEDEEPKKARRQH